ncbi:MAG TPA: MFS transporter [Stellaceae bacterium]|nr:MFS transporter [Stellaceae bacterium]
MLRRMHYAWIVFVVTFLVMLTSAGVRATPGVLMVPWENEFGWSAATIGTGVAINIFLYGLVGPFAVAIFERFGLRRSITIALIVLSAGVFLTSQMSQAWQMTVIWGVLVGTFTGMVANVLGATIAGRWFSRNRGLVLGMLTAANATGQLVFLPILAHLATNFGWRSVSYTVAGVCLVLVLPVVLFIRNRPADIGLPRFGDVELQVVPPSAVNPARRAITALSQGLRSRDFWLLSGTFFVCGASTNGLIGTHLIPACSDHGIPETTAAGLLALMGFFDLFGTTASGWLSDRIDSRKLLAWYYGLRGLSLMFLPYSFNISFYGLSLFAVFYGLDWIATVPPTVKLAARAFGEENAPLMFGWIAAAHQVGAAFAAWLAGVLRTDTGDYFSAFVSAGFLCLFASGMALMIGRGARDGQTGVPEPVRG